MGYSDYGNSVLHLPYQVLYELVSSDFLSVTKEEVVFEAIASWCIHNLVTLFHSTMTVYSGPVIPSIGSSGTISTSNDQSPSLVKQDKTGKSGQSKKLLEKMDEEIVVTAPVPRKEVPFVPIISTADLKQKEQEQLDILLQEVRYPLMNKRYLDETVEKHIVVKQSTVGSSLLLEAFKCISFANAISNNRRQKPRRWAGWDERRKFLKVLPRVLGLSPLEFDSFNYNKITFLVSAPAHSQQYYHILYFDIPSLFPKEQPLLTRQPGTEHGSKNYPYDPKWSFDKMAENIKQYLTTEEPLL